MMIKICLCFKRVLTEALRAKMFFGGYCHVQSALHLPPLSVQKNIQYLEQEWNMPYSYKTVESSFVIAREKIKMSYTINASF